MTQAETALSRRWARAFTVGEVIGFGGVPVVGGLLATSATASLPTDARALVLYAVAILGGLAEGAILGAFQLRVLRGIWPEIDGRRWIRATAIAAAIAWSLGMIAPTLDELIGLPPAVQVAIWAPAGALILISIGLAQSQVLRRVVDARHRWLRANVMGWLLGLPWTFVAPAIVPDASPLWVFGVAFLIGGTLMGATAGLVTGRELVLLARSRR